MNAILMSIQPKWASKILSGEKTIEVRKTAPKEVPFKVYIYCTKGQELWGDGTGDTWKGIAEDECLETVFSLNPTLSPLNGKVVAEFICSKVEIIPVDGEAFTAISKPSCLTTDELIEYCSGRDMYGLHISALKIYDTPKELGEFKRPCIMPEMPYCPSCRYGCTTFPEDTTKQDLIDGCECEWGCLNTVTRPPQNYMFVEEL
jgi:predicted transcriptional regulator